MENEEFIPCALYSPIPKAIMEHEELEPLAKLLYGLLLGVAVNKNHTFFGSDKWIAEKLKISLRQVTYLLKQLEEWGLITRETTQWENNPFRKKRIITVLDLFKKSLRTERLCGTATEQPFGTEPNARADIEIKQYINKEENSLVPSPSDIETAQSKTSYSLSFSTENLEVTQMLWNKVKAVHPKIKPTPLDKWQKTLDLMVTRDKRTWEEIKQVITYAFDEDPFWFKTLQSAEGLRRNFDKIWAKMSPVENKAVWIKKNKTEAYELLSNFKTKEKGKLMRMGDNELFRIDTNQAISFNLHPESFKNEICKVFNLTRQVDERI